MKFILSLLCNFLVLSLVLSVTHSSLRKVKNQHFSRIKAHLHNKGSCDSGFGKSGFCYNIQKYYDQGLPSGNIKDAWDKIIYPIVSNFVTLPSFCAGDFLGSDFLGDKTDLSNALCPSIPLDSASTYGGLSLYGSLPCASGSVSACFVFDKCGTFALTLSGGAIACLASLTGIGNALRLVDDALQQITLGFSWSQRFSQEVQIPVLSGDDISFQTIGIRAHLIMSIGVALPVNMTRAGKKVADLVEISGTFTRFCEVTAVSAIDTLLSSIKSNNAKTIIQKAVDTVSNLASTNGFVISGAVTFKLADITSNFLQDFSFSLPTYYMVLVASQNSYGLEEGIYHSLVLDLSDTIKSAITGVYSHFEGIFDALGIGLNFGTGNIKVKLGVFLSSTKAGLAVDFPGFSLHCTFRLTELKGSCKINASFFTAILDGVVWVFKKATKFFEETGEEIARIGKSVAKFTTKTVKSGVKAVKKVACKVSHVLFGTKCKKNSNPSFTAGDGSIFRFKKDDDNNKQLGVADDCADDDSASGCVLTQEKNTDANVWRQLWEYTGDHKICNVMIDTSMYGEQSVENNRKCITGDGGWKNIKLATYSDAITFEIFKVDNHRFEFRTCNVGTRSNCKNSSPKYAIYFMNSDGSYTSLNSHSSFVAFNYTAVGDY